MRKVQIEGKKVEIYDSIEDMPIERFHKYSKMLLIDAGIGGDLSDVDSHIEKITKFLSNNETNNAIIELSNLRQNIYFIQSGLSPKNLAFAVIVKSIDGVECNDLSDDGIKHTLDLLSKCKQSEMTDQIDSVKKKIDDELQVYFPTTFDDVETKEYHDILKRRTLQVLKEIIEDKVNDDVEKITDKLVTYFHPHIFTGKESSEISFDKQYNDMCLVLSQNLNVDTSKMSVLQFYNAFEFLKKQIKEQKRSMASK